MIWQDITITIIQIILGYSLFPQIIKGFKEKNQNISIQTSFLSFTLLYVMGISMLTLKLYLSGSFIILNATFWLIIFIQTIKYKK